VNRLLTLLRFAAVLLMVSARVASAGERASGDADAATVAAQFFRAGRAAYDHKEYRAAALAFLEAYRHVPRGAAIYNAGRSWEAALESDLAADAFAAALDRRDLDPEDAAYSRDHLEKLEALLGIVDVAEPVGAPITVRGVERGAVPLALHLAPGKHEVHARRRDGSDVVRAVVIESAGARLRLELPDVPATPAPAPPPRPREEPNHPAPRGRWGAWVSLGAAAALAVAGVYTYARFAAARSTFEEGGSHDPPERDTAQHFRTSTYVLWGAAAALGALGGALVLATSGDTASRGASAALGVGPAGIVLSITR
jgi:hypothetical protein